MTLKIGCPCRESVPERITPVGFAATANVTVAGPLPVAVPPVMVSQASFDVAVHVQPALVATANDAAVTMFPGTPVSGGACVRVVGPVERAAARTARRHQVKPRVGGGRGPAAQRGNVGSDGNLPATAGGARHAGTRRGEGVVANQGVLRNRRSHRRR